MHLGAKMSFRIGLPFLIFLTVLQGADKKLPIDETSNENLEISASPIIDKDQIKQELGSDLGGGIVVVRIKLRPVTDKPIRIDLDDFTLVSGKDGQHSRPFAPSQIAGSDTLKVVPDKKPTASPGWSLGGLATIGGIGAGSGSQTNTTNTTSKVENNPAEKSNDLLTTLRNKVLQEKDITEPISGLLYFQMVGKVKPKDLELHYKGPAGRMALRFGQ
jgi:hypothetical protein